MFGIAKPCRHELSPELRRQYRAHMCGLCLSLRDHHGQPSRAVTNVDAIVLSILVEAQRGRPLARAAAGPCPLRGMQPASVVASDEGALAHASAVSLLAASVKICDHAVDGDGPVGRIPGTSVRIAGRLDAAGRRRAAEAGFDPSVFDRAVDASVVAEERHGLRFEEWSAPTEEAMAEAARHTAVLAGAEQNLEALGELGRMFGRLTYLLDAVEDEADDVAAGRFNALVAAHPRAEGRREEAQRLFTEAHRRLEAAFDALDLRDPTLARHLLVDQLGRRGRRVVGLSAPASCAVHHGHRHGRSRNVATAAAVVASVGAWALATLRMGVSAGGWGPGYPPPEDPRKKKRQDDDPSEVGETAWEGAEEGGCDLDCCPCDGDGCSCGGCDCCDGCCCDGCCDC